MLYRALSVSQALCSGLASGTWTAAWCGRNPDSLCFTDEATEMKRGQEVYPRSDQTVGEPGFEPSCFVLKPMSLTTRSLPAATAAVMLIITMVPFMEEP